ncbi:MAG TPA: efflux RND transporter permease subunit [Pedococcus sp.]|nr:efflux RND transporter permease subunit [Pedococcus sp.]
MIRWIITQSLRFRFLMVAFGGALMFFGIAQVPNMPVDVFPEFAPPRVEIQTPCLGLSAAETESLVTVPLEQALQGVPGLDELRSKSVSQLSSIELIFTSGTDLITARQLVNERLQTIVPTLPTWAAPPFILQPLSATSRVMKIGLSSDTLSTIDMSMTAYWKIRARLLRVPGVANVAIWGERIDMLTVQVKPDKLKEHGVTLEQVMDVTADSLDSGLLQYTNSSVVGKGGFIETPNQRLNVRHVLPIASPDDLGEVVVNNKDGKSLRLADVADVVQDHQPLVGDAVINGGEGLMLIVEKLPWGNTLQVTEGVEAAMAELAPGLPGMQVDTSIFRPATFVEEAVDNLTDSLLLGSLLVVLLLGLFLLNWRAALVSVVTIPVSLMAAILILHWRGVTINTMVLAGFVIALGAIVDDAIVDVENIVRRLRLARAMPNPPETKSVVLEAALEVRSAIVYACFIEASALLPIFFLTGLTGSFFKPLATAYALAVLVSLMVALLLTPAMSLILLSRGRLSERPSPLVRVLHRGYERLLTPVVRRPLPAFIAAGAIAASGIAVYPTLGQSLLPDFKERDFLMHWVTKPGTSLPEETRITVAASKELQAIPGVRNFGAHIGQALLADEVVGAEFGENWISVDQDADYDATVDKIQAVVDGYPGLRRDVQTYLKERIREVLTGEGEAIVVQLYGQDLKVLEEKADEISTVLGSVDGIVDEHVELQKDVPQIEVRVDLDKARKYGIKPGDVRRAAATMLAGEEVGDIFRGGKAYDVQVWSVPQSRTNLSDVQNLQLDVPGGGHVAMKDVADVTIAATPSNVQHENGLRRVSIGANVDTADLGAVVAEAERRLAEIDMPLEYFYEVHGEYQERQAAQASLLGWSALAAATIFVLLFFAFRRLRLAVMAFVALPSALVGGVLMAWLSGGIISLGSLVGFFTVLGIVARNGIMMVSHFQHLERVEGVPFGPALVIQGAKERLAPVLMTALAAALAVIPLIVAGNVAGQEIEYPMAFVILGGLITATMLNLILMPVIYLRFGKSRREREAIAAQTQTATA